MSKQVVLTGIRANNDLTIGNYFGAILPMIDMAKNRADAFQVNMFVPDLHSFTTPINHGELQSAIWNNLRLFVAAGLPLDNHDIHLYRQSYIPAHSELMWILSCFTGFGEMNRMTQFKEKGGFYLGKQDASKLLEFLGLNLSELSVDENTKRAIYAFISEKIDSFQQKNREVSAGLFNYPILMASDILLHRATYVPVGDDQTQHLEFTRDIAERMNNKFHRELFVIPKPVKEQHAFFGKDQGLRIMDLQDPTKKMSKSDETGKGVIFLNDDPDIAAKKIMSAATDSLGSIHLDWENQPGISNLLQILALFTQQNLTDITQEWDGKTSYGELKSAVAEATSAFLRQLQSSYSEANDTAILHKLEASEASMNQQANETLFKVQQAVGLRP